MDSLLTKIKGSKITETVRKIITGKYFPFVTAAVVLLCYYLGWDIVSIYFVGLSVTLILLLSEDLTPVIPNLLFIGVLVSLKNTPSPKMGGSDYYQTPVILALLGVVLTIIAAALIYRVVLMIKRKKFKVTPVFFGLCVFCAVLFLNGIFSEQSTPKNMLYGLIMAACFLGIFVVLKDNIKICSLTFEKIAYGFIALSAVLIIELIVAYITTKDLFVNGTVNRSALIFGWGLYTTYGVMIVMCIPAAFYLAGTHKYGFLFALYSVLIVAAAFLSCCRQSMLVATAIYPICYVYTLIVGKHKIANGAVLASAAFAALGLFFIYFDTVINFFDQIFQNIIVEGELNGSGRWRIWNEALEYFKSSPIFGVGFYVKFSYSKGSGVSLIPYMCHNTILQILSCAGIFGIATYALHRVQTIISLIKNINFERVFIALTFASILLVSLFDNHIFNIIPTIIYSALIAVLVKSEKKE